MLYILQQLLQTWRWLFWDKLTFRSWEVGCFPLFPCRFAIAPAKWELHYRLTIHNTSTPNERRHVATICATHHPSTKTILPTKKLSQRRCPPSFPAFLIPRPASIVRFRLPLTPPQATDMPPKSTAAVYREVTTLDPPRDLPRLNKSACLWEKADLAKLGVDYQYDRFDEIVIGRGDEDVPAELLQGH